MIPTRTACPHCGDYFVSEFAAGAHAARCPHNPDRIGEFGTIGPPQDSGRHHIETRPITPMLRARQAAGLPLDGLVEASGLFGVAAAEMVAARGAA